MFIKLHDWRHDAVPIWIHLDALSAIQLMPATADRPLLTVVRIGNGSYSEWVRETPDEILTAIANAVGLPSPAEIVAECGTEAQPLTLKETIAAALKAIDGHRYGPLWKFMIATGCRWQDAAGCRWQDAPSASPSTEGSTSS